MKKGSQSKHKISPKINHGTKVKKKFGFNILIPWIVAAFLLVLTWYLYKPSLDNHFTNWDDPEYVLENRQVKNFDAQNAKYFFAHASANNYHPLTMLSLSLDYHYTIKDKRLFRETDELDAVNFHTTSLILHVLNVLLVFIFIYFLSRKRVIVATITALLFAIHPMHVESVSWIAERKDVLYTFFFLAGLIIYVKYLEKPGWMRLVITGLLFLASLFSKPSAVVFPLILLAIDYFYGRKFTAKVFYEKIPFFILAVVFGVTTFIIQSQTSVAGIKIFTFFQRLMFASYGFIMYQYKLLLPFNISPFYPYPSVHPSVTLPVIFLLSPLIALAIVGLVIFSTRFTRVFSFGYLFYFTCIVLVLQFMPVGSAIMADRYAYMSSIGLFFIMAWYLDQAFISNHKILRSLRWILAGVFLMYSIFLIKIAYKQTMVWHNSETLWSDVISKYPQAETPYKQRGNYYGSLNMTDKAMQDFMSFIKIKQDDAGVYSNLGNTYGLRGEIDKALEAYSKSITLDSLNVKTFLNRAITYTRGKQYLQAIRDYNKALELNPAFMEIYANRSYTFLEMGRFEDAVSDFSRLIQYSPRNDNYFMNRGVCYFKLKQYPGALADFEQCIALNPANGQAYFNASATCNELKDYLKAYQYALKAISLDYKVDKNFLETLKKKSG